METRRALAASLLLEVGAATDIGLARHENQDTWGKFPPIAPITPLRDEHLLVVADGMGGHEHGQQASRLAVRCLHEAFFAAPDTPARDRLRVGIEQANAQVHQMAQQGDPFRKSGTTCTALALSEKEVALAHVGDSRAYRVRDGRIEQLSNDHTKVAELQRHGILKSEEARHHAARSVLTRAVGVAPTVMVDVEGPTPVRAGDIYVLCTDGLGHAAPEEIRDAVQAKSPQAACDALVQLALARGGEDNITVMVARITEERTPVAAARPPDRTQAAPYRERDPQPPPASPRRRLKTGVVAGVLGVLLAGVTATAVLLAGGPEATTPAAALPAEEQAEPVAAPIREEAAPPASVSAADEAVAEGDRLLAGGEPDLAAAQYEAALRVNPLHLGALDGIARVSDRFIRLGDDARARADCAQARAYYRRAAAVRPGDTKIQQMIAACEPGS